MQADDSPTCFETRESYKAQVGFERGAMDRVMCFFAFDGFAIFSLVEILDRRRH